MFATGSSSEYGEAFLDPTDPVVAGSYGTWRLTYVAGSRAMDPGGRVAFAWRWPSDWGRPQFAHPSLPDFASLHTSGTCRLEGAFLDRDYVRIENLHPWDHVVAISVLDAPLQSGQSITVTLGDRSGGSPGSRAQTFRERACEFHVLVDPAATGAWLTLERSPHLRVVGGPADRLVLVGPADAVVGDPFEVTVRAEDRWNNPASEYRGRVAIMLPDGRLAAAHAFGAADDGVARIALRLDAPGVYRLVARDDEGRHVVGNPVICHAAAPRYRRYWGDPHCGQSVAGCGAGSVEEHFRHLRDVAATDFGTHQGNCFMLSAEEWAETCRVSKAFDQPRRFVAFLGYEWSGDTEVGGDHNVLFLDDDQPICRSSHRLVADKSDVETDLPHILDVYRHYAGRRVLLVPHVGGRPSNLTWHSPELEPVIEIHSGHATSEWFLHEALDRGYRVGFTGGSDDVMGRPGASYPGLATGRNTRGGLTLVYATELTREGIAEALWARRTCATTGERIVLWVEADGHPLGSAYATVSPPRIRCQVWGTSGIERLELFRGRDVVHTASTVNQERLRERTLRIAWSGATARGTGARAKLVWDGALELDRGRIAGVRPYGFDGGSDALLEVGERLVRWRSTTAFDSDGIIMEYDAPEDAVFTFRSPVVTFSFRPADVGRDPFTVDAGPESRRVVVSRLPEQPAPVDLGFEFVDEAFPRGTSAYFVRVVQDDDAKAWSSPIYVTHAAPDHPSRGASE